MKKFKTNLGFEFSLETQSMAALFSKRTSAIREPLERRSEKNLILQID